MTQSKARPARRIATRKPKAPKAARDAQAGATLVFRDFVRQLEKLDARPANRLRDGAH